MTDALTLHGWRWMHVRRSDKALTMGQPGFPDLLCLRGSRAIAIELKRQDGTVTDAQWAWLVAFSSAGIEGYAVRPSDLDAFLPGLA